MMWFILVLFMLLACWFFLNEIVWGFIVYLLSIIIDGMMCLLFSSMSYDMLHLNVSAIILIFVPLLLVLFTRSASMVGIEKVSVNQGGMYKKTKQFLYDYRWYIVAACVIIVTIVIIGSVSYEFRPTGSFTPGEVMSAYFDAADKLNREVDSLITPEDLAKAKSRAYKLHDMLKNYMDGLRAQGEVDLTIKEDAALTESVLNLAVEKINILSKSKT